MFQIPKTTKWLLIANVLSYAAAALLGAGHGGDVGADAVNRLFGLHFIMAPDFRLYQLLTYMFMHGSLTHLFFNMFALWMFGCVVESVWGGRRFLFYYMLCGIGAGLFQEAAQFTEYALQGYAAVDTILVGNAAIPMTAYLNAWTTVGASGAVYGILLAFGMLFPEQRIFIFPLPVPIKARWFVIIYAAIELVSAIATTGDGVAHTAHLGGMVFGFFLIRHWARHPYSGYGRRRGGSFFSHMRSWKKESFRRADAAGGRWERADMDFHSAKSDRQKEIDTILDKIRRSGYDSLSGEEKRRLFEESGGKN